MQALTPEDVRRVLEAFDPSITIHFFEEGATATSEMAATEMQCEVGQIAKSLCFLINGDPILVIASGDVRIDDKKIAKHFGVGRKKVRMARAEQCLEIYGYPPGGVPPVGHRTPDIPRYLDTSLQRYDQLYAAAGTSSTIFPLTLQMAEKLTQGIWVTFTLDE